MAEVKKPKKIKTIKPTKPSGGMDLNSFLNTDKEIQRYRNDFDEAKKLLQHVTTAPTYTPKTFFEQFVVYDDGANYRLYIYINSNWRYVALT